MLTFLTNLFQSKPNLAKLDLFIIGESYAGHYVPAITSYLVQNAKQINLKGVGIGNGFIDPGVQTASFGPFIYAHGLMTKQQLAATQAGVPACQKAISGGHWSTAFNDCNAVLDDALNYCSQQKGSECNVYNIEAPCNGQLCYNMNNIIKFLNTPSVQKQLGVTGINWQPCDTTPYTYLENDFEKSYQTDIPIVLAAGVPVTVYNGMLDIICNFYGEADVLSSMVWPGQSAFNAATNTTWMNGANPAGTYRTAGGLTYVAVADAGHMVPHDQPANALALLSNILTAGW